MECHFYYRVLVILSVISLEAVTGQRSAYHIPEPIVNSLTPRGFRVSIPDDRGVILFAFHGSINKAIQANENGDFSGETRRKSNGFWTFENNRYRLQPGDILNFWIYVQHENFGYKLENQRFIYPDDFVSTTYGGSNGGSVNYDEVTPNYNSGDYTTQRTTTLMPYLVFEDSDYFTQGQYQTRPTSRPTIRTTRTTTTTARTTSSFGDYATQRPQQGSNQNCYPSITTVNKRRINCKDSLIFEEQFDYNFLNRWSQDIRMPLEFEDAEFVVYENYPSVWNVSNANLNIFPKLLYQVAESGFSESDIRSGHFVIDSRDCTTFVDPKVECERQAGLKRILPPVVTAKFRSKKSFNFKYGRVEIRAKLPKGDWIFPQIYLEPTDNIYRGVGDLPYLNGQIRVAFIRGNEQLEKLDGIPLDGKILTGICVLSGGDTVREVARKSIHFGQEHFGNDFHTYSLVWTNSSIRFAVDGLEYGTDTGGYKQLSIPYANYWESGTNMAPFDQEFHISLGVAAGGNADFADDSRSGWSKTPKPWENTSPKAELSFYLNANEWHSTWNTADSGLIVDYVKVYSV